ncbi:MAG: AraC family transcriptional regulator, partial [Ginsengibacter sp.]
MQLYIKNMVCNRCLAAVKQLLDELKLRYTSLQLGEVNLLKTPSEKLLDVLKSRLIQLGFELLDDAKMQVIDKIKTIIIEYVHYGIGDERINFSELLTSKVNKDYSYLSNLFSETEGITIEKYMINQKVEKI